MRRKLAVALSFVPFVAFFSFVSALADVPGEGQGDFVRFELEVTPAEAAKLVLVEIREDRGGEIRLPWTLVRADGYLPPDLPTTPWMAFRGRRDAGDGKPEAFRRELWLVIPRKGEWQVASVAKREETRDGIFVLQTIRPGEKGEPVLVYSHETDGRTLTRKPSGFERVRVVKFQPPPR